MREFLIDQLEKQSQFGFVEQPIHRSELENADELIFTNAVRGARNAASIKGTWTSERTQIGDHLRALLLEKLSKSFISF